MNKINALIVSLISLVVAVAALVVSLLGGCDKGQTQNVDVEAALKANPGMVLEALQAHEAKQQEEAAKAASKNIKENASELYNRAGDGIIANPNGKIVLVEFFDFACSFCSKVHPAIKEIIANNPDVKVVAKPMAFLSPASKYAAEVALAAQEQGKFAEVYHAIFESDQGLSETMVDEIAAAAGLDIEKLKADMKSSKVQDTLNAVSELSRKIQVTGVPTLIVNDKVLQTLDAAVIQDAINSAK